MDLLPTSFASQNQRIRPLRPAKAAKGMVYKPSSLALMCASLTACTTIRRQLRDSSNLIVCIKLMHATFQVAKEVKGALVSLEELFPECIYIDVCLVPNFSLI